MIDLSNYKDYFPIKPTAFWPRRSRNPETPAPLLRGGAYFLGHHGSGVLLFSELADKLNVSPQSDQLSSRIFEFFQAAVRGGNESSSLNENHFKLAGFGDPFAVR